MNVAKKDKNSRNWKQKTQIFPFIAYHLLPFADYIRHRFNIQIFKTILSQNVNEIVS